VRVPRVLQANGTLDTTIGYDGGLLGGGAAYPGAVESAARWEARSSCCERRQTGQVSHDTVGVGDETSIEVWEGCADGRAAGMWTMELSGHIQLINNDFPDAAIAWMLRELPASAPTASAPPGPRTPRAARTDTRPP
jgi:poly(3-hydroxybutyrate) depolymerase